MRINYILASLLLVACNGTKMADTAIDTAVEIASHKGVLGHWDVVRFDNFEPNRLDDDGRRNAYVDFRENGTSFRLTCNFSGNSALVNAEGNLVISPDGTDSIQTLMGCGRKKEKRDQTFFKMMRSAPHVEHLNGGLLRLTTEDHELILERARIRQMKNAIRDITSLQGEWNVAMINQGGQGWGGSAYAKQPLYITEKLIKYGKCSLVLTSPHISEDANIKGQLETIENLNEACENLTEAENVLLQIISNAPIAEPIKPGNIQLSHKDLRVVLTKGDKW